MLIDESKMAVDSSFSFLNLRKQHTNPKLKLLFKSDTQKLLSLSKTTPLKLFTKWLYEPITDTQSRLTAYETYI